MTKRIITVLLIIVMVLVIVACDSDNTEESKEESTTKEIQEVEGEKDTEAKEQASAEKETDEETEEANEDEETSNTGQNQSGLSLGDSFETGPYTVTVNSIRKSKDYEGNPAIVINYDWTNNSEDTTSWLGSIFTQVFQDGVSLERAFIVEDKDSDMSMKDVRPGTTIEGIEEAFVTTSENELEIEVQAAEELIFGEPVLIITDFPN